VEKGVGLYLIKEIREAYYQWPNLIYSMVIALFSIAKLGCKS